MKSALRVTCDAEIKCVVGRMLGVFYFLQTANASLGL